MEKNLKTLISLGIFWGPMGEALITFQAAAERCFIRKYYLKFGVTCMELCKVYLTWITSKLPDSHLAAMPERIAFFKSDDADLNRAGHAGEVRDLLKNPAPEELRRRILHLMDGLGFYPLKEHARC